MFRMLARIAAVGMIGLSGAGWTGAAQAAEPGDGPVWGVGRLPIQCVQAPCQTKGLFPLNPAARAEAGVIWFDEIAPPPMLGPRPLIEEIHAAYRAGRCLRVAGHFSGSHLTVLETRGDC